MQQVKLARSKINAKLITCGLSLLNLQGKAKLAEKLSPQPPYTISGTQLNTPPSRQPLPMKRKSVGLKVPCVSFYFF